MEYKPLLSETSVATTTSNENKSSSSKRLLLLFISVVTIISTFVAYNNGLIFGSNHHHSHNGITSGERNEKLRINLESIEFKPDLEAYKGQSIELVNDPGTLEIETFTNMIISGKFHLHDKEQTLSFIVNGNKRFASFELTDSKSGDLINTFYSAKNADPNSHDYYQINGIDVDTYDPAAVGEYFSNLYSSDLTISAILLSIKIASLGYTGPMAKSIRMIHSIGMHWIEMDDVKVNIPPSVNDNRIVLNKFFEYQRRRMLDEEETKALEEEEISLNPNVGNDLDWCLFWCDSGTDDGCPGGTDGCPSTCYIEGECWEEDKCDNECFGGCGDSCDCWSWVCGDCDCHCLCQNHDYFCSCVGNWEYECYALWEWIDDECD